MKIRVFVEASSLEETNELLDGFKEFGTKNDFFMFVTEIEKYWKIDDMYRVCLDIDKSSNPNVKAMLNKIASKWMELPNEFLASKTMDDCEIYIPKLYMITLEIED